MSSTSCKKKVAQPKREPYALVLYLDDKKTGVVFRNTIDPEAKLGAVVRVGEPIGWTGKRRREKYNAILVKFGLEKDFLYTVPVSVEGKLIDCNPALTEEERALQNSKRATSRMEKAQKQSEVTALNQQVSNLPVLFPTVSARTTRSTTVGSNEADSSNKENTDPAASVTRQPRPATVKANSTVLQNPVSVQNSDAPSSSTTTSQEDHLMAGGSSIPEVTLDNTVPVTPIFPMASTSINVDTVPAMVTIRPQFSPVVDIVQNAQPNPVMLIAQASISPQIYRPVPVTVNVPLAPTMNSASINVNATVPPMVAAQPNPDMLIAQAPPQINNNNIAQAPPQVNNDRIAQAPPQVNNDRIAQAPPQVNNDRIAQANPAQDIVVRREIVQPRPVLPLLGEDDDEDEDEDEDEEDPAGPINLSPERYALFVTAAEEAKQVKRRLKMGIFPNLECLCNGPGKLNLPTSETIFLSPNTISNIPWVVPRPMDAKKRQKRPENPSHVFPRELIAYLLKHMVPAKIMMHITGKTLPKVLYTAVKDFTNSRLRLNAKLLDPKFVEFISDHGRSVARKERARNDD